MLAVERVGVLVTVSAGALIASAIAASPTEPDPPRPPDVHVVPLAGDLVSWAVEDAQETHGGCLPFLTQIKRHPHWALQLVEGARGCVSDNLIGTLTITDDGWAAWSVPQLPTRNVKLTPGELSAIEHLDEVSCAGPTEEDGYPVGTVRVGFGDLHAEGAAHIPRTAPAAKVVEDVFDSVTARYVRERRAQLGDVELGLIARATPSSHYYRVHLANDRIVIDRRGRTVLDAAVQPADLVDFVDWAQHTTMAPSEYSTAIGMLTVHGEQLAVALEMFDGERLVLARMIADAVYRDDHP